MKKPSPEERAGLCSVGPNRKILVVEDSRTQAEYLTHILKTKGYEVLLAADGREALDLIRTTLPAIVLTDIVMPEMDGYELCRQIKAGAGTAGIQVILVTQLFDAEDVVKGLEAGADNFIIKPYNPEQIYSHIKAAFEAAGKPDPEGTAPDMAYQFAGKTHHITAGRSRMLDILLSTYEYAIRKNAELQEAHENQSALNEELTATVEELHTANRNLSAENAERGRVERALAEANNKLNLMTSITRHDILNKLTALGAYLSLTKEAISNPTASEYLSQCEKIVDSVTDHIEFMKDYQSLGITAPLWQDLDELVRKVAASFGEADIVINRAGDKVEIFADPLFEKVIYNLLDNAVRHGERVRTISFFTRRTSAGISIICEDDGVGISHKDKKHLFRKGFGKNTGFGLFLIREVLGITGITITETGIPGVGARFEMMVPENGYRYTGA